MLGLYFTKDGWVWQNVDREAVSPYFHNVLDAREWLGAWYRERRQRGA